MRLSRPTNVYFQRRLIRCFCVRSVIHWRNRFSQPATIYTMRRISAILIMRRMVCIRTMEKSGVCYRAVERCPARLGNAVGHGYGFGYVVADVVVAYEVVDMALDEGLTYLVVDT